MWRISLLGHMATMPLVYYTQTCEGGNTGGRDIRRQILPEWGLGGWWWGMGTFRQLAEKANNASARNYLM